MRYSFILAALALVGTIPAVSARAGDSLSAAQVDQLKKSVVYIRMGRSSGSGFVIDRARRLVATNEHVVSGRGGNAPQVILQSGQAGEKTCKAQVLVTNDEIDLAVLKVEGTDPLPDEIKPAPVSSLRETMTVFVAGFPFGEVLAVARKNPAITISRGTVTSLRKNEQDRLILVQIDADVNPGNSGGPVLNDQCQYVGVATMKLTGTKIALAVPASMVDQLLTGRVSSYEFSVEPADDKNVRLRVGVQVMDPFECISSVTILYLPKESVKEMRQPQQSWEWPAMPDARSFKLKKDRPNVYLGTGEVPRTELGKDYLVQVTVQRKGTFQSDGYQPRPYKLSIEAPRAPEGVTVGLADPSEWSFDVPEAPAARAFDAPPGAASTSVFEPAPQQAGLRVERFRLPIEGAAGRILWSADGARIFFMDKGAGGALHEITMATGRRRSMEFTGGLLDIAWVGDFIAVVRKGGFDLVEPDRMRINRRISLPEIQNNAWAAGCRKSKTLYITVLSHLICVDMVKGDIKRYDCEAIEGVRAVGFRTHVASRPMSHFIERPALSPDGGTLYISCRDAFRRLKVNGLQLSYEEAGPVVGFGEITFSADGRLVATPCFRMPETGKFGAMVYGPGDLQKPEMKLVSDIGPYEVSFDQSSRLIYASNAESQFVMLSWDGKVQKAVRWKDASFPGTVSAVPSGGECLVLTPKALFKVKTKD
jgi:S1-C subfamily serine protease